jgi:aspartate/methionine/tyrosine aminotransferase
MPLSISRYVGSVEYAIRDIIKHAREYESKGNKVIYLNIGDPVFYGFDTPKHIKDALIDAVLKDKNYYADSEGVKELREAIAEKESSKGIQIMPDDVIVTNGVSEALDMLISSIAEPGDEVLVPGPCYPPYLSYARVRGVKPVEYASSEDKQWHIDIDDLKAKINERTRAIFVINPNNPTGYVFDSSELRELVDVSIKNKIYLVCDEIYDRIVLDGEFTSICKYADSSTPLILLNGFSKVYLMTGWRLGYICFNSSFKELGVLRSNVSKLARLRLSANTPAQIAAVEALKGSQVHIDYMVKELRLRRDYVMNRLDKMQGLSYVKPHGAFYIFPRIGEELMVDGDVEFVLDLLRSKGVLVVQGSGFGRLGSGHFRLVFLPSIDILETAMNRIEEFIDERIKR